MTISSTHLFDTFCPTHLFDKFELHSSIDPTSLKMLVDLFDYIIDD